METTGCDQDWPVYTAISYTWGDATPTLPISVDGEVFHVRLQCWYALWQVRQAGLSGNIWIDSICINQEDNAEKSAQVAMMGTIYASANLVAACIGMGDTLKAVINLTSQKPGILGPTSDVNTALDDLGGLPYFNRLWIKQEIILANKVKLLGGTWSMRFQDLSRIIHEGAPASLAPRSNIITLYQDRQVFLSQPVKEVTSSYDKVKKLTLFDLIARYGKSYCVESKDRIYALLSLLSDTDPARQIIAIEYGQSNLDLFIQVLRAYCLNGETKLQLEIDFLREAEKLAGLLKINPYDQHVKEFLKRSRDFDIPRIPRHPKEVELLSVKIRKWGCIVDNFEIIKHIERITINDGKYDFRYPATVGLLEDASKHSEIVANLRLEATGSPISPLHQLNHYPTNYKTISPIETNELSVYFSTKKLGSPHYIVPEDTKHGDILGCFEWQVSGRNVLAVFRKADNVSLELKGWAYPTSRSGSHGLSGWVENAYFPIHSFPGHDSRLELHPEDAGAFFLQSRLPLSFLSFQATTPRLKSRAFMCSRAQEAFGVSQLALKNAEERLRVPNPSLKHRVKYFLKGSSRDIGECGG